MATHNTALRDLLLLSQNQALWIQDLINALGPTRSLTIKHFPAATAQTTPDQAWASGTVVWQSSLIGSLAPSNGALRTLGKIVGVTVRQAADLSTGLSVMQVAGNGNWMQTTVGLVGSDREVKLPSLTGAGGLAFGSNFAIHPPQNLPVDAGVDRGMPYRAVLDDWSAGVKGASQTIFFDSPQAPIVWEDAQMLAQTGAIPYCQSTGSFIHGDGGYKFEIGVHRFRLPASCNDEVPEPVWQMLVAFTPKDRWPGYPTMLGYDAATDSTILKPFRLTIYKQDGSVWHIFQSRNDGTPINHQSWGQTRNESTAYRPFVNTAQMLYHCSHRLKESSDARKYYAGTRAEYWDRPRQNKGRQSVNPSQPVLLSAQVDGFGQLAVMPRWARTTSLKDWESIDKSDSNVNWVDMAQEGRVGADRFPSNAFGWDYDYGAMNAGHDFRHGVGGLRFERFPVPSQLAYAMTHPTGVRTQDNVPWRTIWHSYAAGYFNLSWHHIKNAKTMEMLPFSSAGYGLIGHDGGYYGGRNGDADLSRWIHIHGMNAGHSWTSPPDRDGLRHYSGLSTDNQHGYQQPAWEATQYNSVAHAISQKLRYFALCMSWNRYQSTPTLNWSNVAGITSDGCQIFTRQHAWTFETLNFIWKTGAVHPLLVSRAESEEVWRLRLESLYDNTVVPLTDPAHPNHNHYFFQGLRNLGLPIKIVVTGDTHSYQRSNDDKWFYFFGALMIMKSMGCFDRLKQINSKCSAALDFCVMNFAKLGPERFVKTKMRSVTGQITPWIPTTTPLVVPANWEEVAQTMIVQDGSDMVRNADGTQYHSGHPNYVPDRDLYQHLIQQCVYGFKSHFHEYNVPFMDAAVAMSEDFEQFTATQVAQGGKEFGRRFIAAGPMLIQTS